MTWPTTPTMRSGWGRCGRWIFRHFDLSGSADCLWEQSLLAIKGTAALKGKCVNFIASKLCSHG